MLRYPSASVVFASLTVLRSSTKSLFVLPSVGWGPPLRPGFRVQDFAAKVGGPLHQTLVERLRQGVPPCRNHLKSIGSGGYLTSFPSSTIELQVARSSQRSPSFFHVLCSRYVDSMETPSFSVRTRR